MAVTALTQDGPATGVDDPPCMTVTNYSSSEHLGPCRFEIDTDTADIFAAPCAAEAGLRSADSLVDE